MSTVASSARPVSGIGWRDVALAVAPLVLALIVAAVVLGSAGHNPLEVYWLLLQESFGGVKRIAATVAASTPLILTGLATAVAFRTGVFNVGVEGCVLVGGLAAAFVGFTYVDLPATLLLPLALGAAVVAGTLWMLVPAVLKARLDVDEVVTTLMLNFIAISLTAWLVNGPLLAPGSANSATPMVVEAARLPRLMPPSTLNAGFLIAMALLVLYWLWGRGTALGLETRLAGLNPRFAIASGINVPMLIVKMMLLSGALAVLPAASRRWARSTASSWASRRATVSPASRWRCWGAARLSASCWPRCCSVRWRRLARPSSSSAMCPSRSSTSCRAR
nr:ABC transporter permease [Pseudaminobacter salicylatoxidans]